jgi:hypothetical protein
MPSPPSRVTVIATEPPYSEMKQSLRSYDFAFTHTGYQDLQDASGPTTGDGSRPSGWSQSYTPAAVN